MKISVLTLNIWNNQYRWIERRKLIARLISDLNPDIIGLQEVVETDAISQAEELSTEMDSCYEIHYVASQEYKGEWSGNALLSKISITDKDVLKLTQNLQDPQDQFARNAISITCELEGIKFTVINTHLSLSKSSRESSVREIMKLSGRFDSHLVLLIGDLNAPPDSEEVVYLSNSQQSSNRFFVDTWDKYKGDPNDITWPTDPRLLEDAWKTKNSAKPFPYKIIPQRMDYIFFRTSHELEANVIKCERVMNMNNGLYASDHFGLFSELKLVPLDLQS